MSNYNHRSSLDLSDDDSLENMPSYNAPEMSPTMTDPTHGQHLDRPQLVHATSSEPLMGDISGENTPLSPAPPYDPSHNPFASATPSIAEVRSSLSSTNSNSTESPLPPKIHINSIPNTPENPQHSTFQPHTQTSPFNDEPSSISRRRSSQAPSTHSTQLSYAHTSALNKTPTQSIINSTTQNSRANTIAKRRSERIKSSKPPSKSKGEKGVGGLTGANMSRKPFESTRLKGEIYKPWLEKKDPAQRWARWITLVSIILGFALAAFLCYDGYAAVPNLGKTCIALNEDFSNGIDPATWHREVRLDGYGNGAFTWTTTDDSNAFVQDSTLYIVPTLTSDVITPEQVVNGYTLNLTADGTCTSGNVSQCVAVSNSSHLTIINPVRTARLTTVNSVNLKYGKVEVKAKFPTGDWLWPRISLLPVNDTYGAWPLSGQIDILTARGNNASYTQRGVDYAQSDLHWGPNTYLDRLYMTWGYRQQRRTYYNQEWHTFGLEWNEDYLWTYIDSKVSQVISLRFKKESFWQRGNFPPTYTNMTTGDITKLTNPWYQSENNNAPFDQPFYLVIDLAVGGLDGWFPDGEGGKPWLDNSPSAMSDFWVAKDKWWKNWPSEPTKRGFAIDSVKMWKTC